MLEVASDPYPPIADYTVWLSDVRRADMTPEELEERHRLDREAYRRMRERMATDPVYREARLTVSRGTTRRWQERNRDRLDVKLLRLNRDRAKWASGGEALNQRRRDRYVGERAEVIRARNRDWYARNRELRRAYRKAHYLAHGAELRAKARDRGRKKYNDDPRKVLDYYKAWRKRNLARARGYVRISNIRRRAVNAVAHFTLEEWLALLAKHDGNCAYCGSREWIEADHRIPLCRGGTNSIDNILPACRHCNRRKHQKTEDEFRALLDREKALIRAASSAKAAAPGGSASAG
jgi:5-methylcytosine-specific restriction endonuclease McrA